MMAPTVAIWCSTESTAVKNNWFVPKTNKDGSLAGGTVGGSAGFLVCRALDDTNPPADLVLMAEHYVQTLELPFKKGDVIDKRILTDYYTGLYATEEVDVAFLPAFRFQGQFNSKYEQILAELRETVESHNKSEVPAERVKLRIQAEKLQENYRNTSKLTAYATCLEAANPMLAFVKMYKFPVVSVGSSKETGNLTVKAEDSDGEKLTEVFNLWDFVSWAEGRNKQVTVALDWKSKSDEACKLLRTQVQEYHDNGTAMGVIKLQTALQVMFDSIVKVTAPTGRNAIIIKSKEVRLLQTSCGSMDVKKFVAKYATTKTWQKLTFALLHGAIEGKDFTCVYGDEESKDASTNDEPTTEEKTDR
jgi:hypothetical protein